MIWQSLQRSDSAVKIPVKSQCANIVLFTIGVKFVITKVYTLCAPILRKAVNDMETVIAAVFLIGVLIFAYALCKSSGTKGE